MGVTGLFSIKMVLKGKMSAILKRHCYHSNGNDVIFVNNFQLLEACSIYVVQFLSSNKETSLQKIKSKSRFCHILKTVLSHLKGLTGCMGP